MEILRELALKLGTTVDQLWLILVAQAPISAVTNLLLLMVGWSAVVAVVYLIKTVPKEDIDDAIPVLVVLFVVAGITIIETFKNTEVIVAGLFNPEYWALLKITEMF